MVIDEAVRLMGSYNWTRLAAANSEDLNMVSSPAIAAAYTAHWHRFDRREDWCRATSPEAQSPTHRGND